MSSPPSYITANALSEYLLQPPSTRPSIAIIDVRDDDHVGGHIYTSTHVPSSTLDYRIPELVRTLSEKDMVVFHCALSQQRGPTAARRYVRERVRLLERKSDAAPVAGPGVEDSKADLGSDSLDSGAVCQKVYILDGGFVKWQEKYGRDTRLTEAYAPDIWVDYS
ncbi:hypothetical protein MMC13_006898 [Lambiella insularis]|nr:hypothetical protein [Lambiella insularis]